MQTPPAGAAAPKSLDPSGAWAAALLLALASACSACAQGESSFDAGVASGDLPATFVFGVGGPLPEGAEGSEPAPADTSGGGGGGCNSDDECDDFDDCTTDQCDRSSGNCVFLPRSGCDETCFVDDDCDDGDPCTTDRCAVDFSCVHADVEGCVAVPCTSAGDCDAPDECTLSACVDGFCTSSPDPQCSDGCQLPVDCDDSNACTDDVCDAATGVCSNPPRNCDDGDACTADACDPLSGCVTTALDCDDNDRCTDDACDPLSGCVHTHNEVPCNDGFDCTGNDRCRDGACLGTPDGPAMALRFNDGAGDAAADSAGANHAALVGGATFGAGRGGTGGVTLPGSVDAFVRVPSAGLPSNRFTLSMWVRKDGDARMPLWSRTMTDPEGRFAIYSFGSVFWGSKWLPTRIDVPAGEWTHVTVAFDGTGVRQYQGGRVVHEQVFDATEHAWSGDLQLGAYAKHAALVAAGFSADEGLRGAIDDVLWFDRVLTDREVQALTEGESIACMDDDPCTRMVCAPLRGGCVNEPVEGCPAP